MQYSSLRRWKMIGAIGAIMVAIPYIVHAYGPTEAEVAAWGMFSLAWGIILLLLSLFSFGKIVAYLGFSTVALVQIPPIILWFLFHGQGISDGSPPSGFTAHWGYSMPHILIFLICAAILYKQGPIFSQGIKGKSRFRRKAF